MAEGRTAWPKVDGEWFVEPEKATEFLIDREDLTDGVFDPCCGQGNIVRACLAAGIDAVGSDIATRIRSRAGLPPWFLGERDYLATSFQRSPRKIIVMNPPYGRAALAEAFIREAVNTTPGVQKVCAFVNSKFLFSDGRAEGLYAEIPPDRIYPVRPRPSCPPGAFLRAGGKAEGGIENFVWLIWDLAQPTGRTEFIWR